MRLWPVSSRAEPPRPGEPSDARLILRDLLRRNLEDLFEVKQQGARGRGFIFGGELRVPPDQARQLLEARFKPHGYTPFLAEESGMAWIEALPISEVSVRPRPALNITLFILTVLSTLYAGGYWAGSLPFVTYDPRLQPHHLLDGVPFAFTLLAILGTHEYGHYFTARRYGAPVSLPYFIPAPPPLPFGTLGAIIVMRAPARNRNSLFDIAVAGPLAGLVVAIPAVWLGLTWSRLVVLPDQGGILFGDSLLMKLLVYLVFGPLPARVDVLVHPVALAGWVGLLVTALNLMPISQLDGGRIAYALVGARHRQVSIATFFALLGLSVVGMYLTQTMSGGLNWLVFATLVFLFIGFRHAPPIDDVTPLSRGRRALGVGCLILLVALVPPVPILAS
jgi:membrane-associated protease RseP (regulator of RpoE activity)